MHRVPVNVLLGGVHVVDVVEGEGLVRAEPGLRLPRRLGHAHLAGVDDLARQLRADPGGDAHAALVVVPHLKALCFQTTLDQTLAVVASHFCFLRIRGEHLHRRFFCFLFFLK